MSRVDPLFADVGADVASYIAARRWFRGKARVVSGARLIETIPLGTQGIAVWLAVARVEYVDGVEEYALPLLVAAAALTAEVLRTRPHLVVRERADGSAVLDATSDPRALRLLLGLAAGGGSIRHGASELTFRPLAGPLRTENAEPHLIDVEQSNTSIVYGDKYILKLIRKLDPGVSADLEMGEFLTRAGYRHAPLVLAAIELARGAESATVGILHQFVANRGDAWGFFLERLRDVGHLGQLAVGDALGEDRARLRRLGERVAELHVVLASRDDNAAFAPAVLTRSERVGLAATVEASLRSAFAALAAGRAVGGKALPLDAAARVALLLPREGEFKTRLDRFVSLESQAMKTRVHGDLHLGQILITAQSDFVLIDFEGEPARPLAERKAKRSPLVDIAGVLRSLHYAVVSAARANPTANTAHFAAWHRAAAHELLDAYFAGVRGASWLPSRPEDISALLTFYLLEKCVYEVHYELNNRPDWVAIPLAGLTDVIEGLDAD